MSVSSIYEMTNATTEDDPNLSYSQTPAFTHSQPKVRKFVETSALISMPLIIDTDENIVESKPSLHSNSERDVCLGVEVNGQ